MSTRALVTTLVGLIAALVASILIWHFTPSWTNDQRLAACLAPLVLWGLVPVVVSWARRHRKETESRFVRDQKKAVLKLLKPHKLAGRRARYRVPLFLVLGANGVGKSSLIADSVFSPDSGVRVGDSVWWVAEDAILVESIIDPANKSSAHLAALLAALRPDLPLNSILLVSSPADLALMDHLEHEALAEATTAAVNTFKTHAHRPYPVYLLLSKIDLVPGFREYFDRYEPQECDQIWGFGLPFHGLNAPPTRKEADEALTDGFRHLLAALRLQLIERLSQENAPARCNRINGFGPQIAMLLPTIQPVIDALIPKKKIPGFGGVPLRGIFLTSSRQEGLSIDPLLPKLSGRFAMPRSGTAAPDLGMDETSQSFFNNGVFNQALRMEAGLAHRHAPRRGRLVAHGIATACIVIILIAAGTLVYQHFNNVTNEAAHVQATTAQLQPIADQSKHQPKQLDVVLTDLQQLATLEQKRDDATTIISGAPGFSSATLLHAHLAATRANLRHNALAPHLAALLEAQLIDPDADNATRITRIRIATQSPQVDADTRREWLEKTAGTLVTTLPESLQQTFVKEGMATMDEPGGLTIDPAYIKVARYLAAYPQETP